MNIYKIVGWNTKKIKPVEKIPSRIKQDRKKNREFFKNNNNKVDLIV